MRVELRITRCDEQPRDNPPPDRKLDQRHDCSEDFWYVNEWKHPPPQRPNPNSSEVSETWGRWPKRGKFANLLILRGFHLIDGAAPRSESRRQLRIPNGGFFLNTFRSQ